MSIPEDPLALVPADYPLILSQSFGSCCGLTALLLALEQLPAEERFPIKQRLMNAWESMWRDNFRRALDNYNTVLGKTTNSTQLPQPEELQLGLNRALAEARKSAWKSLGEEEKS